MLIRHSTDSELDKVSTVFDDSDGVRVEHVLSAVAIDLKQLITNLPYRSIYTLHYSAHIVLPYCLE